MNSEQYLLHAVQENFDGKVYVRPTIPDKILVNSALKVASGIDTSLIIGCVNVSLLWDGMEGFVFSVDTIYLHEVSSDFDNVVIPLADLTATEYDENSTTDAHENVHVVK